MAKIRKFIEEITVSYRVAQDVLNGLSRYELDIQENFKEYAHGNQVVSITIKIYEGKEAK